MRIAELMTRLPEGSVESTSLGDPECEIHNVSFLTQEAARAPHDDVIYFSDGTNVPEGILDSQQFSCVIANASQRFDHLGGKPNVNLVRLRADVSPFACYNAVQAVFVEEREK